MSSTQGQQASLKILIIDDDIVISDILRKLIEKMGGSVKCIYDGREVGNALISFEPDVIFLDLVLPGIDGVEIIQGLGRADCKANIVLMSGLDKRTLSSVSEVAKQNQLRVITAILKPITAAQIEAILQPLIDSKLLSTGVSSEKQAGTQFGPLVSYEPEIFLNEVDAATRSWVRLSLSWRMDDNQLMDIYTMIGDSVHYRIAKGVIETVISQANADSDITQIGSSQLGIKISLPNEMLRDDSTPDYLDQIVKQTTLENQSFMLEIDEAVILNITETKTDVLSRLKIKGFKLAVCVREKSDEILAILSKLPIDELVVDMANNRLRSEQLDDAEIEFQMASLVSFVSRTELIPSVKNVLNEQQAAFAKRCKFSKVSGRFVGKPMDSQSVRSFFEK